jgi:hypothetical protein
VEFRVSGGIINIIPSLPSADDEYTPAQRRAINAGIAEGRKGPYYGPFKSGAEVAAFLKEWKSKGKPAKLKKIG